MDKKQLFSMIREKVENDPRYMCGAEEVSRAVGKLLTSRIVVEEHLTNQDVYELLNVHIASTGSIYIKLRDMEARISDHSYKPGQRNYARSKFGTCRDYIRVTYKNI